MQSYALLQMIDKVSDERMRDRIMVPNRYMPRTVTEIDARHRTEWLTANQGPEDGARTITPRISSGT
jgi:hypothetical protein